MKEQNKLRLLRTMTMWWGWMREPLPPPPLSLATARSVELTLASSGRRLDDPARSISATDTLLSSLPRLLRSHLRHERKAKLAMCMSIERLWLPLADSGLLHLCNAHLRWQFAQGSGAPACAHGNFPSVRMADSRLRAQVPPGMRSTSRHPGTAALRAYKLMYCTSPPCSPCHCTACFEFVGEILRCAEPGAALLTSSARAQSTASQQNSLQFPSRDRSQDPLFVGIVGNLTMPVDALLPGIVGPASAPPYISVRNSCQLQVQTRVCLGRMTGFRV